MSGLPSVTVIGTLTADPTLKFTPSGHAVASFSIASNERKPDGNGGWQDGSATFLRCSIWRDAAENLVESVHRGDRVIAVGRLKQREYEKDGEKRTVYELDVDEIGPSTRWAQTKVSKANRSGGGQSHGSAGSGGGAPVDDPWGSAPASGSSAPVEDEPPF